jgi:hypothetical protein
LVGLLALSIPLAAEMVFTEALFVGHIVFLVEALGFAGGLAVFVAIWAVLGLVALVLIDLAWPRMSPWVREARHRVRAEWRRLREFQQGRSRVLLVALALGGAATGFAVCGALFGGDLAGWAEDNRSDLLGFAIVAIVLFVVLAVMGRLGRGLVEWVRHISGTAGPLLRWLGTLTAMAVLGPAFGWLLFRPLGYSRRAIYGLTLAAAPVFGAVWVPLYGLGVWGLADGLV